MAIHKIKSGDFVIWTGDEGKKQLDKAFKELIDKQLDEYYGRNKDKIK